jgi:hypothetical protein
MFAASSSVVRPVKTVPNLPRRRSAHAQCAALTRSTRLFASAACALWLASCTSASSSAPRRRSPAAPQRSPSVAAPDAPEPAEVHARNVILLVIDGLRADALGDPVRTPAFARLAREGVAVSAESAAMECVASYAALLTGVDPATLGIDSDHAGLPDDAWTLTDELRCQGFKAAMFSANGYLEDFFGFDLGWDEQLNYVRDGRPRAETTPFADTQRWVDAHATDRFFVFTVVTGLGLPFAPISGVPPADELWERIDLATPRQRIDARDVASIRDGYARRVERIDAELGALLDRLVATGRAEDTLVVVTSDHGEWLGERGRIGHRHPDPDPGLRAVPLFFWGAATPHPPPSVVRAIDVAPTILASLGMTLPGSVEGASIRARALHGGTSPRTYESAEPQVPYELCMQLNSMAYGTPSNCAGLLTEAQLAARAGARLALRRCPAEVR